MEEAAIATLPTMMTASHRLGGDSEAFIHVGRASVFWVEIPASSQEKTRLACLSHGLLRLHKAAVFEQDDDRAVANMSTG